MATQGLKYLSAILLLIFGLQLLQVNAQQQCTKQSDIVFVMDQSGSIEDANPKNGSWDNWQLIKNFIIQIMTTTGVSYDGTHYGLVTFGNIGVPRFHLTDHLDLPSISAAVQAIPSGNGETNLYAGLNFACNDILSIANGARPDVPQIIIIITDGFANINTQLTLPQAQACQDAGVKIFAIGVTGLIDENQLMQVSSPPHQKGVNYWTAPDFTALTSVLSSVEQAACNPPKDILDECKTIDICFAIDIPQAATDFTLIKSFINRFITLYLPIGSDAVRVCIITFDDHQAKLAIPLNGYYNETALKAAIDAIPFVPSNNGDPAYALQLAASTAFTAEKGARGSNFNPTIITMLNNPIYNAQSTIDAYNAVHGKGIRSIAIGETMNATISDMALITYVSSDVIVGMSYSQLSSQIGPLSSVLCQNSEYVLCPMAADICLALDESTSIVAANGGYANWYTYILGFAKSLVNSFPIGPSDTRIGALTFSSSVNVQFELADYTNKNDLLNAIGNLNIAGGETDIEGALRVCRTDILSKARPNVPHIVMLVTDGVANVMAQNTLPEANLTKAAGATIYTVGVTDQVDVNQLKAIASSPSSTHFFYVSDYSQLDTVLTNLIQTSCITTSTVSTPSTSTTTTSPTPAASSSTSKIITAITSSTTTSQTTTRSTSTSATSTTAIPSSSTSKAPLSGSNIGANTPSSDIANEATNCTGSLLDIVLILDQSTSIVYAPGGYDNWYKHILGFAVELASAYKIGPNSVQIGVVKFSDVSTPAFFLNTYKDNSSLIAAIQGLTIEGGETNIAAAQNQARNVMFSSANGARSGVKQVVYLLTDGVPNRQQDRTYPENDLLKATGAQIYTIGVTSMTDPTVCQRLASQPYSNYYYYVNDFSQLKTIVGRIVGNTCNQL